MSGNFGYDPLKTGAEKGRDVELILAALIEAQGTALASDVSTYRWAQLNAEARCIAYLWSLNRKMANQWDANRMTDFLPRWERIMQIVVPAGATEASRRRAVGAKQGLRGKPPIRQVLLDLLNTLVPELTPSIINSSSSVALGQVSGGATVPGGVTLPDGDWYSSIAMVTIKIVQPANWSDPTFYAAKGGLMQYLDLILPGWCTFDVITDGSTPGSFILDDPHNLDNERLS